MRKLSDAATTALVNTATHRQGATVFAEAAVLDELALAGLIGDGNGLTRRGTVAQIRAMEKALAAAFG